jgi:phenylacetate-coenzyme A ligase PaaK-like adenylate-forming protein
MTTTMHGAATPQEHAAQLFVHDGWDRERLLAHHDARLAALLRHAVERSPYYRETLGHAPWERALSDLPVLTKADLMANWDAIVTSDAVTLARTEADLADPGYDGVVTGGAHACTTSGTTGRRGVFVLAPEEMAEWLGANIRALGRIGVGPDSRVCAIGSPSPVHMSRQIFRGLRPSAPLPPVSVVAPIEEIAAFVQAQQPDALIGYPTVYAALAEEQLRGRLDIAPRAVAVGSEVLTEEAADRIRRAWGVEPRQAYPTTEVPMIASGRPDAPELMVNDDLVVVEVVDEQGAPVPHGTPGHRVLLTSLVSRLQPLIRYELADAVTTAPSDGRFPYSQIARIDGRTSEIVELPAAAGGTVRVHCNRLRRAFARLPEVGQHQLRISPARVTGRFVAAPGAGEGLAAAVERELAAELRELGVAVPLTVEPADEITRDAARAGKLPAIVIEPSLAQPPGSYIRSA